MTQNKIKDINDLVSNLFVDAMRPVLDNEIWKCYGYKKRPKHGSIVYKFFPQKFALETFISKTIFTISLIDLLNGIKKSNEDITTKLLISIGIFDTFFNITKEMFTSDQFMEDFFSFYDSYIKREQLKLNELVILKAKDILDKKNFIKFMFGTTMLLTSSTDFLIKSDYFKNIIENSSKNGKLSIAMSEEIYNKYMPLIKDKILNT